MNQKAKKLKEALAVEQLSDSRSPEVHLDELNKLPQRAREGLQKELPLKYELVNTDKGKKFLRYKVSASASESRKSHAAATANHFVLIICSAETKPDDEELPLDGSRLCFYCQEEWDEKDHKMIVGYCRPDCRSPICQHCYNRFAVCPICHVGLPRRDYTVVALLMHHFLGGIPHGFRRLSTSTETCY